MLKNLALVNGIVKHDPDEVKIKYLEMTKSGLNLSKLVEWDYTKTSLVKVFCKVPTLK